MAGDKDTKATTVVSAGTRLRRVWKNCKKISPTKNENFETKLRIIHTPVTKQSGQYRQQPRSQKNIKDEFSSLFFTCNRCDVGKLFNLTWFQFLYL